MVAWGRVAARVAIALGLVIALAAPALAHEGEENVPASTLVQEAIAIIRSQPDQMDAIADKINDALDSNDAEGVDLDLVGQARAAFESGDLQQTELLLEQAIGLSPGEPVVSPNSGPRTPPPPTAAPSLPGHLRALDRSPVGGAQGAVLLGLAAALALAGVVAVRRFR